MTSVRVELGSAGQLPQVAIKHKTAGNVSMTSANMDSSQRRGHGSPTKPVDIIEHDLLQATGELTYFRLSVEITEHEPLPAATAAAHLQTPD